MKKAQSTFSKLVMMVFLVIAIIVFLSVNSMIKKVAENTNYETTCKASIAAFSKLSKTQSFMTLGTNSGQADQKMVDCPTQYIILSKKTAKTKQTEQIARLMAQCYNVYGEGKLPLLPISNQVFCGVCSVVEFEDKTQVLTGLPHYLMAFKIPFKVAGTYPTYLEYISGKKVTDDVITKWKSSSAGDLQGSKQYAIMYLYLQFGGAKLVYDKMTSSPGNMLMGIASPTGFVFSQEVMGDLTTLKNKEGGSVALVEYNTDTLKGLGCAEVPFSQLTKKYR